MRTLQRFLLVALLTALLVGCQPTPSPVSSVETSTKPWARKIKQQQDAPEGPKLRPGSGSPGRR
jgi:hypothetical protein